MERHVADRRRRSTFWLDDRVIDAYGPAFAPFPFGSAALAVYAVLARHADRDGEAWPSIATIARLAACSVRTAQRALRLLELAGLVAVEHRHEAGSNRQASSLYTLLTPAPLPPPVPADWKAWPPAVRAVFVVPAGAGRDAIKDARPAPQTGPTPCQPDTPPGVSPTPPPVSAGHPPGVSGTPLEGQRSEGTDKGRRFTDADERLLTARNPRNGAERRRLAALDAAAADPARPAGFAVPRWADQLAQERRP